jgi:hypothetical protein
MIKEATSHMVFSKQGDETSRLLDSCHDRSQLVSLNYCIPGIMSRCSAGLVWQDQKKCKFARKSTVGDRCMHYIKSINGHCDSVEAQRELRNLDRA